MAKRKFRPPEPGEAKQLGDEIQGFQEELAERRGRVKELQESAEDYYKSLWEKDVVRGLARIKGGLPDLEEKVKRYVEAKRDYEEEEKKEVVAMQRLNELETWAREETQRLLYREREE